MNCEKCQELLSDFLDGALHARERALLSAHLEECLGCSCIRDELQAIVSVAQESRDFLVAPPNERALWLRIRNTIESELSANQVVARAAAAGGRENFFARLSHKRWALSLPQLTTAVAAIVVGVSLATALSVQSLWNARQTKEARRQAAAQIPTTAIAKQRIPNQEINYLMQRVEERKGRWNPRMRETFERNMSVINAAVNDSLDDLNQRPHDEVSEEALDAALREKMELLKEFSDL